MLRSPIKRSSSCITDFTSAFWSVNTPTDMPDIQLMSNISTVSIMCLSSSSVPERISKLRVSSPRIVDASRANGSRMRIISRTPTNRSGTICTE